MAGMVKDWLAAKSLVDVVSLSIELSVGAAVSVLLADGQRHFIKVWPENAKRDELKAQLAVQALFAERGFPAPRVNSELMDLGPACAVLMEYNCAGVPTDVRVPGVLDSMARGLARFVRESSAASIPLGLPLHHGPHNADLWPKPHNALFDFESTTAGAEWIDAIALEAKAVLRSVAGRSVVGHLDWSAKNMRMSSAGVAVVYDWDSVFWQHEAIVVGLAAGTFPATWEFPIPTIPPLADVSRFIRIYEDARELDFSEQDWEIIAASVRYAQAYVARCEHACGLPNPDSPELDILKAWPALDGTSLRNGRGQ